MSIPKNHQQVLEFIDICTLESGVLFAPALYSITKLKSSVKYNMWQVFVGVNDYNIKLEDIIGRLSHWSTPAYIQTKSGRMPDDDNPNPKITISVKTLIKTGKSIGRANYTTTLTQAILQMRTKYNNKVKAGSKLNMNMLVTGTLTRKELAQQPGRGEAWWRVFPMAIHDVNKKNNWRHIVYPLYIQKKLDGTRIICTMNMAAGRPESYSRRRETISCTQHILDELDFVFEQYPDIYLDGEYYEHGVMLQEVSGISRQDAGQSTIKFHVFDTFIIGEVEPYHIRRERTRALFMDAMLLNTLLVDDMLINTHDELDTVYNSYISDGYEGAVLRNVESPYEYGLNKELRSYQTMKIKPRPDAEFPVVGYTQGKKGKSKGAIVWICSINADTVTQAYKDFSDVYPQMVKTINDVKVSHIFNVTPNIPYDLAYKLYQYLETSGDTSYMNKLATISFSTLSKDAKPQQPKFLTFRDKDYNDKLIELAMTA